MKYRTTYSILFAIFLCFTSIGFSWEYIFRDKGDNREDQLGHVIEGIGDQNQDGFDDILVQMGRSQEWFIYYGGNPMDTIPDWSVHAYSGGNNLGDLNGDGIPEFFLYFTGRDENENRISEPRIYYGGDEDTIPDLVLQSNGYAKYAGDINGDGYNDVWQVWSGYNHPESNFGRIWLYLGSEEGLDTIPDFEITDDWNRSNLGSEFTSGGDLNGDGYDDFCCTSRIYGDYDNKILHIYFGGEEIDTSIGIHHDLRDSIGEYEVRSNCEIINDMNGDNIDELIFSIGDHRGSLIIFGRENFRLEPDVHLLPGNGLGGYNPISVGDVNRDGFNDLFCRDPAGVANLGKINLFLGGRWMDGNYVFRLTGWSEDVLTPLGNGRCYHGCGDVNGDGFNDIMFSAYGGLHSDMGEVYIIGGSDEWQTKVEDDEYAENYPNVFSVVSIFPNPFNNSLNVSVNIHQTVAMSIRVYNVSGSQVATIDSGEYNQGRHEFEWSAEDLPSGIYFLRIITNKCNGQFYKIVFLK